ADAGERFSILGAGFAAVRPGNAGLGHEVAFVTAVDEDAGGEGIAVFHPDGGEARALFGDGVVFEKALVFEESDAGALQHLAEDVFGDVRLVEPGNVLSEGGDVVVFADAVVELVGVAADDFFFAVVGPTEAAGYHAADVGGGFEQRGFQAFARGRDGGDDATGRSAVDHDVEGVFGGWGGEGEGKNESKMAELHGVSLALGAGRTGGPARTRASASQLPG